MARIRRSHRRGPGSIPGQGNHQELSSLNFCDRTKDHSYSLCPLEWEKLCKGTIICRELQHCKEYIWEEITEKLCLSAWIYLFTVYKAYFFNNSQETALSRVYVPDGLVARIRRFHRRGPGSIPGQGNQQLSNLRCTKIFQLLSKILTAVTLSICPELHCWNENKGEKNCWICCSSAWI